MFSASHSNRTLPNPIMEKIKKRRRSSTRKSVNAKSSYRRRSA
jgi:hypothetical protein